MKRISSDNVPCLTYAFSYPSITHDQIYNEMYFTSASKASSLNHGFDSTSISNPLLRNFSLISAGPLQSAAAVDWPTAASAAHRRQIQSSAAETAQYVDRPASQIGKMVGHLRPGEGGAAARGTAHNMMERAAAAIING